MQSATCAGCGAPLTPGARFCTYCGAPAAPPAASPLPVGPLPSSGPPMGFPPPAAPPPARPRRSRALMVIVIIVVIVLVLSVVAFALTPAASPPPIRVGELVIWAPNKVCDLNASAGSPNYYYFGFNGSTSSSVRVPILVPDFNATSCTVRGVTTNTTGFTVAGTPLPLIVTAGSNASMNLTITTPSSSYSGNVNLIFS